MPYLSLRPPRVKQREALEWLKGRRAGALLMAMRTGKTKVVVDDWGRLVDQGLVRSLLVIAPAGVYKTWEKAIRDDAPPDFLKNATIGLWVSGKEPPEFKRGPRVLLMNSEAISMTKKAREYVLSFLRADVGYNMVAVDESVIIKNKDSVVGKFMVEKVEPFASYKRILTGLLSPRSPVDVYNQFKFLDRKIFPEPFGMFQHRYCKMKHIVRIADPLVDMYFRRMFANKKNEAAVLKLLGTKAPTVKEAMSWMTRDEKIGHVFRLGGWMPNVPVTEGFQNLDELHKRIAPHSFRVALEDCADLPAIDYSFRDVAMTKDQKFYYQKMKKEAYAELESLGSSVTATQVIVQILRLHQILCGFMTTDDGDIFPIVEDRTDEILSILEDYEGKALIWCAYDYVVQRVSKAVVQRFGEKSLARFWGGNLKTREAEELSFRTDPAVRFLVATPDAGGKGRTWDVADLAIYHSCRNNLDHRLQSEERIRSLDKTRQLAIVDLRCPGTVEEPMIEALRAKQDMANLIVGKEWKKWL